MTIKLQKKGNADLKNSALFCYVLLLCYFVVPYLCSYILPDDFYVFSAFKKDGEYAVLISFMLCILFFYLILRRNKWVKRVDYIPQLSTNALQFIYLIFIVQLTVLALSGTYYRLISGINERDILLEKQHVFLFSGTSYIFVCGFLYMAAFVNRKKLLLLSFLFVYIDILFMGKKFVFYLVGILLYRSDISQNIKSTKPFIYACIGGMAFLIAIYVVRALTFNSDANILLDVYAVFSEFIGVYATVGWAVEFNKVISSWWLVVQELSSYYRYQVGHGLALHPVAYFIAVFGDSWLVGMFVYLLVFSTIYYLTSMLVGSAAVLILLVNIMHFMRHGPEIFLQQFVMQAVFLSIILYFPKLYRTQYFKRNGV
ncbi:hypothetical protein [Catenovulum sediminis]|uniref:hypothetical protein n=1 Tax=Catenovulum sediminis TaxID=1740262 RepID=UPI001181186D|nr:hypothetical protein [Catenovulum sediminis]